MKMRKMKGGCVEMDRKKINVERMRKDELNKLEDKYKMNLKMMRSVALYQFRDFLKKFFFIICFYCIFHMDCLSLRMQFRVG